jgi:transcription termination/antitermination protein NusA
LSPAKISRVTLLNPAEKHMEVVVDDLQLSLAIGKRGQNVRLAAKLIGWKIDIKSEEEKRREVQSQMADMVISGAPVSILIEHGLDEAVVERLVGAGIGTVERLGSKTPEELEAIPEITEETVSQIQTAIVSFYGQYDESVDSDQEPVYEEEQQPEPESVELPPGALEHDFARNEPAPVQHVGDSEVLDLGQVEGLSGAPSSLNEVVATDEVSEADESATIKSAE